MTRKFTKNFDAMIAEMNHETVSFTMFGNIYEIEKRMPATIPLELSKYDDEDGVPSRVIFKAARNIFGDKILDELCSNPKFTTEVLNELVKWAFEAINGSGEPDEPEAVTEDDMNAPERKN